MCFRMALFVFIYYNMEMFNILGEYKLSIQNPVACKFAKSFKDMAYIREMGTIYWLLL